MKVMKSIVRILTWILLEILITPVISALSLIIGLAYSFRVTKWAIINMALMLANALGKEIINDYEDTNIRYYIVKNATKTAGLFNNEAKTILDIKDDILKYM